MVRAYRGAGQVCWECREQARDDEPLYTRSTLQLARMKTVTEKVTVTVFYDQYEMAQEE